MGFYYVTATTVGTLVCIVISYIANKLYVFKSRVRSVFEIVKFLIVYGIQYLSFIFVVHLLITYAGTSAELAGIPALGVGVLISFLGHKFWSFR